MHGQKIWRNIRQFHNSLTTNEGLTPKPEWRGGRGRGEDEGGDGEVTGR